MTFQEGALCMVVERVIMWGNSATHAIGTHAETGRDARV